VPSFISIPIQRLQVLIELNLTNGEKTIGKIGQEIFKKKNNNLENEG